MKRVLVIWNPMAGRVGVEAAVHQAARVFEERGWQARVEKSQSGEHVTRLAQEAAAQAFDAVFVAGGDGSLGRAVAGLIDQPIPGANTALGVLPTGTANVWAREIGLPVSQRNQITESAERLAAGHVQGMDVGVCNGRPFLFWAGFGLDGRVVDQLERNRSRFVKRWNEIYYLWTILQCSARWGGVRMQVQADDQQVEGKFMLAVAGNIQRYAGGLARLSPEAVWNDGKMELWLFGGGRKVGTGMAIRHLWNLGWGRHVRDRHMVCLPFQHLKMTFSAEEWMQLDGEPWGTVREAEINIKREAVRVLVP